MDNNQIEIVNIETLVAKEHTYRKLKELIDFKKLTMAVSVEEKELGTEGIEKIFNATREQLKTKGYLAEVFIFIDGTALISKLSMWEERDKAISDGYEKFNNEVIEKYSKDKEVRIGAKSKTKFKTKFLFGFKKHVSVDMQSGMINKVKVTQANMTDADGTKYVCPDTGAVTADKDYIHAIDAIKKKGCHPMVIMKNNMKDKIRTRIDG